MTNEEIKSNIERSIWSKSNRAKALNVIDIINDRKPPVKVHGGNYTAFNDYVECIVNMYATDNITFEQYKYWYYYLEERFGK